jgi:hypothetical protein
LKEGKYILFITIYEFVCKDERWKMADNILLPVSKFHNFGLNDGGALLLNVMIENEMGFI